MRSPHPLPRKSSPRRPARARLAVEQLECRSLPAANFLTLPGTLAETVDNDTLDRAQDLGAAGGGAVVRVLGAVGTPGGGASADVDFYSFTLAGPAAVHLTAVDPAADTAAAVTLSLYNADFLEPAGGRLLTQSGGSLDRVLGPGTYYLAVSGAGNSAFHPFLAGSGYDGAGGAYGLSLTAVDVPHRPGDGPAVLTVDAGVPLTGSPLNLRVGLSGPVDPGTLIPGDTVRLTFNPTGDFGGPGDVDVPLAGVEFRDGVNELVVTPAAPLGPGSYRLTLAGDPAAAGAVVAAPDGTPLGADFGYTFAVTGVEGNTTPGAGADDTADTARDLGDLPLGRLTQVSGAIGDDPTDPTPFNPSDVDLYHFRLTGDGTFAFAAEVFAGRIGSALDPALTLFKRAADGSLVFVAGNGYTANDLHGTNFSLPLLSDAVLYAGLTAGDYYLAVGSGFNYADPAVGLVAGADGVFDPLVSHSGMNGNTTGTYLLNLKAEAATVAPAVVSAGVADGATLDDPPATLAVTFNTPVNVTPLAFNAYQTTFSSRIAAVFVRGADGNVYFPRLTGFDAATNTATFLMIDPLPPGSYELHLSGPLGLTDLAGNPLAGNDPSGDHVVRFTVGGAARTTAFTSDGSNGDMAAPQDLGTLFPTELAGGVTVTRAGAGPATSYYQFTVLQDQDYGFSIADAGGNPAAAAPQVWKDGVLLAATFEFNGSSSYTLTAGTYVIGASWPDEGASEGSYVLTASLLGSPEPAAALTAGPAPALRLRLAADPAPTTVTDPLPAGAGSTATPPAPGGTALAAVGLGGTAGTDGGAVQFRLPQTGTTAAPTTGTFAALSDRPLGGPQAPAGGPAARTPLVRLDLSGPDTSTAVAALVALSAPGVYGGGLEGAAPVEVAPEPRTVEKVVAPAAAAPKTAATATPEKAAAPADAVPDPVVRTVAQPVTTAPAPAPVVEAGAVAAPRTADDAAPTADAVGSHGGGRLGWMAAFALTAALGLVSGRKTRGPRRPTAAAGRA